MRNRAVRTRSATLVAAFVAGLFAYPVAAQQNRIVGTVIDQLTLRALAGARITVIDQDIQTRSDENGNFIVDLPTPGSFTMRILADGFSSAVDQVEVTAGEVGFVQVQLVPVAALLDEILVRSGRQPRREGVDVRPDEWAGALSAADLLEREVPGIGLRRTGEIGTGSSLTIRGISSLTGDNTPLIYLDGIRISEAPGGPTASIGPQVAILHDIPANQVRRIRVLRGPSAAARYGDSANGVILIETFRGEER